MELLLLQVFSELMSLVVETSHFSETSSAISCSMLDPFVILFSLDFFTLSKLDGSNTGGVATKGLLRDSGTGSSVVAAGKGPAVLGIGAPGQGKELMLVFGQLMLLDKLFSVGKKQKSSC